VISLAVAAAGWVGVSSVHPEITPPSNFHQLRDTTQQAAADFLGLERMHVSQISQRLERDGLIARRAHKDDARAKTVVLTEMGQKMLARAMPLVEAHDRQFFRGTTQNG